MNKESGDFVGHFNCIADEYSHKQSCSSSDGLAIYQHKEEGTISYDGFCWSCNQYFNRSEVHGSSLAGELGIEGGVVVDNKKVITKPKKEPMTKEQVIPFIKEIGYKSNDYRGIPDKYSQFYGHLTKLDAKGNVVARFYPETEEDQVTGYKSRVHPKSFGYCNQGRTGIKSQLSGQIKFKSGGKYLLIVGGEEDKAAAFCMLRESQIKRGQQDFEPIAVVSPTTGESSAAKQVAQEYDFCNGYDVIVIGMDNDSIGKEAALEIAKVLPAEKVKIALWSSKDPNKALQDGKMDQFVRDFYNAKPYLNTGVKSSTHLMEEVEEFLKIEKLSLPPYMKRMQDNMRGGIGFGRIVNIVADTSVGKSSHLNNMVYHWIFNTNKKVGIISLEATAAEYAMEMLSIHLEKNLSWFKTGDEVIDYLHLPEVKEAYADLFTLDNGEPRFFIVDEREGKIEVVEQQIEKMYKKYDCNIIVIDVLSDLLRSLDNAAQEKHMMFQKLFVKNGAIICNSLHTRKPPPDKEGKVRTANEFDAIGSSSFIQSAHINIVLNRDKLSNDNTIRNTTVASMPKCRGGITGDAGKWYYDYTTRKLQDLDDYLGGVSSSGGHGSITEDYNEYIPEF